MSKEKKKNPTIYPFYIPKTVKKEEKEESDKPLFGPKRPPTYNVYKRKLK